MSFNLFDRSLAMTSTSLDRHPMADVRSIHRNEGNEKHRLDETPIAYGIGDEVRPYSPNSDDSNKPLFDNTHRKLKPRHIQLIGIGGYASGIHDYSLMTDAERCPRYIAQLVLRSMCR